MKEHKKTTRHLQKQAADVGQSSCIRSSLPCFCPFFRPFFTEMNFTGTFFPYFLFFFGGFETPSKQKTNVFIVLRLTLFARGKNTFCASDERFSAGGEHVENVHSNFSPPPTQLHMQLPATFKQNFSQDNCFSPVLTFENGWQLQYHPLVLTSEYATPTSSIRNSVFYWTKWPSSRLT